MTTPLIDRFLSIPRYKIMGYTFGISFTLALWITNALYYTGVLP